MENSVFHCGLSTDCRYTGAGGACAPSCVQASLYLDVITECGRTSCREDCMSLKLIGNHDVTASKREQPTRIKMGG